MKFKNLGKSFGTLEIQHGNLAQGLEALREKLPEKMDRASQPMYTGIVKQVQDISKRESDIRLDHFQALLRENKKAIKGVGATVQRCEYKIERVADVAHQARNLAQKVDWVTHQVGAGLHQALTQVTGQVQLHPKPSKAWPPSSK